MRALKCACAALTESDRHVLQAVNAEDLATGKTPAAVALEFGHWNMLEALLRLGAKPPAQFFEADSESDEAPSPGGP